MMNKTFVQKFAFWARNVRYGQMFLTIQKYCRGMVLDIGGRDFYLALKDKNIQFDHWTVVEHDPHHLLSLNDPKYISVLGDGCSLTYTDAVFDTVLNIQVIEHVFEPMKMFNEVARVLKPGGHGIFLIPQTSVLHELPHHYYNFTPSWIKEASKRAGLQVVEHKPLGGVFSTMASHMVYLFFQIFRVDGYSSSNFKRNIVFYIFAPLMLLYALVNIPICLFLSLGDLSEGANNHLLVVRKK
jgi:SAM-dependent methyltransferase